MLFDQYIFYLLTEIFYKLIIYLTILNYELFYSLNYLSDKYKNKSISNFQAKDDCVFPCFNCILRAKRYRKGGK